MINRIEVVVNRNVPDVVFGKGDVDKHTRHSGIASEAGKVFCQHHGYMIRFDLIQHFLKAGAIKIGSAVSVVDEENGVRQLLVSHKGFEDSALITYGVRLAIQRVLV